MLTHGREPDAYCHLSVTGLWPGDPNFTISSLARCLHDLEEMVDSDDHTGDLARTTSTLPLLNSLLDQTAFIASMGTNGAVDSTYLRNVQNAGNNVRRPFKPLPLVFMLQMDNSAKDNKNVHVLAFCSELVIRGVFETVEVNFLMVGHTHEDVNALFSKVSAQTINKDVLTLPTLMAEIWDSETMHPVPLLLEEVADYKSYVDNFLGPLVGHSQPLDFRFSMANNVPIYRCIFTVDGPWWPEAGHTLWKKEYGQFRSDQSIGMPPLRRVREGNDFRIDLEGMFLKPPTFAWFKFPLGTIFEIPDLPENVVLYDRYQLVHGAFYLPPEFDMNNDLKILRQDRRGTRLTGTVTMPSRVRYTMIPENDVRYYVERPYTREDFSASFLTNEGMEFRFPAGSSLYMPNQR
ncbi:hypothetical protein R1sor_008308 [Riccia sorocarpa]|uniref:DUF7869 domain-containing protein n=1 Tax=Riccia sorocarpa TaxID=122646 RepID=A0ABD3HVV4_9MARC